MLHQPCLEAWRWLQACMVLVSLPEIANVLSCRLNLMVHFMASPPWNNTEPMVWQVCNVVCCT